MWKIPLTAVASMLAFAPLAWAQPATGEPYRYPYGPHMMNWGDGWGGMVFGPVLMLLLIVAVIAVIVLLVRWLGGPHHSGHGWHHGPGHRSALDILKDRYARGEIDRTEFEERRRVLGD